MSQVHIRSLFLHKKHIRALFLDIRTLFLKIRSLFLDIRSLFFDIWSFFLDIASLLTLVRTSGPHVIALRLCRQMGVLAFILKSLVNSLSSTSFTQITAHTFASVVRLASRHPFSKVPFIMGFVE
jgi:hypothetical protein